MHSDCQKVSGAVKCTEPIDAVKRNIDACQAASEANVGAGEIVIVSDSSVLIEGCRDVLNWTYAQSFVRDAEAR